MWNIPSSVAVALVRRGDDLICSGGGLSKAHLDTTGSWLDALGWVSQVLRVEGIWSSVRCTPFPHAKTRRWDSSIGWIIAQLEPGPLRHRG